MKSADFESKRADDFRIQLIKFDIFKTKRYFSENLFGIFAESVLIELSVRRFFWTWLSQRYLERGRNRRRQHLGGHPMWGIPLTRNSRRPAQKVHFYLAAIVFLRLFSGHLVHSTVLGYCISIKKSLEKIKISIIHTV